MQENTKNTAKPGSAGASGLQKNVGLKPWEIAVKLLLFASGQAVTVEQATDVEFQLWVLESKLEDLIDENGIAAWSFDDRIRLINFALQQGRNVPFVEQQKNSNNSENNSDSELFGSDESASQAVGE